VSAIVPGLRYPHATGRGLPNTALSPALGSGRGINVPDGHAR
jgi:hypothetical protein